MDWQLGGGDHDEGSMAASQSHLVTYRIHHNQEFLENIRSMASKLQKKDSDMYQAYNMIDQTRERMVTMRQKVEEEYNIWYKDVKRLATRLGTSISAPIVPADAKSQCSQHIPTGALPAQSGNPVL